jgi:hypothetical protein
MFSFLFCRICLAAVFAFSGYVSATCLANISSSDSIVSWSSSCWSSDAIWFLFTVCAVGIAGATPWFTPSTCIYFSRRAHFVAPSISSRFRSRFLNASRDRNCWYTEGVLSLSDGSPVLLSLCFAPIAAWSCFSTALIFSCRSLISLVAAPGAVDPLAGWVDVSFS